MSDRRHDRLLALDGVRGLAAVAVVLFHVGLNLDAPWCVGHGALAVDLFFAMSGVVVERAYGARLGAGWPRLAFARARVRRLYPLYLVGLGLGLGLRLVGLIAHGHAVSPGSFAIAALAGVLLLPLPFGGSGQVFPLNGPAWSLFVEAVCNAAYAVVPRRFGRVVLAAAVVGAAVVILAAAVRGIPIVLGGRADTLGVDLARGAFGFGLGVLIGRALGQGTGGAGRARPPAAAVLAAMLVLLVVPRGAADPWLDPLAILILCPGLVALATMARVAPRFEAFCAGAGAISYPLYAIHAPLLDAADRLVPRDFSGSVAQAVAQAAAATLALVLAGVIARGLWAREVREAIRPAAAPAE